jgi:DNA-binding LacI/PurR family transcriptional regulator
MSKSQKLAQEFRTKIEQGLLTPGDRLPSFAEMRSLYGVAPPTVDRIYSTLEREGLIIRTQGSGTFVAEKMPSRPEPSGEMAPLIGVVLPAVEGAFFGPILSGIEAACRANGCHMLAASTRGSSHVEAQQVLALSERVAGLCIVPSDAPSYAPFNVLLEQGVPFVFIDRSLDRLAIPCAASDNEMGGYMATRHLLECGHRRIHFLMSNHTASVTSVIDRIKGYQRALKEADIAFDPTLIRHASSLNEGAGYMLTREILAEHRDADEPLAFFCVTDMVARGVYMALKEAGISIPHQCALIAFDDTCAHLLEPPLSTVRQNLYGMGEAGVRLLLEAMRRGKASTPRSVSLPTELVVRNSSDPQSDFCSIRNLTTKYISENEGEVVKAQHVPSVLSVSN